MTETCERYMKPQTSVREQDMERQPVFCRMSWRGPMQTAKA